MVVALGLFPSLAILQFLSLLCKLQLTRSEFKLSFALIKRTLKRELRTIYK